jgi:hypothetical protein
LFDVLQDILIITDAGKVVASKVKNEFIEEQIFGMLISALSSFAHQFSRGHLNNIEFRNLRFDLVRKQGFIFLGTSSRKIDHHKVIRTLENVAELFFQYYPNLEQWDGNLNIFQDLEKYLNKSRDEMIIELIFKENTT